MTTIITIFSCLFMFNTYALTARADKASATARKPAASEDATSYRNFFEVTITRGTESECRTALDKKGSYFMDYGMRPANQPTCKLTDDGSYSAVLHLFPFRNK